MATTMVQVRNVPVELHRRLADSSVALHAPHLIDIVALAEVLDAALVTCDRRLAHAPA
jgi:predicted nucleic acid-binding protein